MFNVSYGKFGVFITQKQHGNDQEKFVYTRTKDFAERVVQTQDHFLTKKEVGNCYYMRR